MIVLLLTFSYLLGSSLKRSDFSHFPKDENIVNALSFIMKKMPSKLSRVHFHTLGLHAIVIRNDSMWKDEENAVLLGSVFTSLKICDITLNNLEKNKDSFSLKIEGEEEKYNPVRKFSDEDNAFSFFVSPVLVCKSPKYTVGAGDLISSTAFVRSIKSIKMSE